MTVSSWVDSNGHGSFESRFSRSEIFSFFSLRRYRAFRIPLFFPQVLSKQIEAKRKPIIISFVLFWLPPPPSPPPPNKFLLFISISISIYKFTCRFSSLARSPFSISIACTTLPRPLSACNRIKGVFGGGGSLAPLVGNGMLGVWGSSGVGAVR